MNTDLLDLVKRHFVEEYKYCVYLSRAAEKEKNEHKSAQLERVKDTHERKLWIFQLLLLESGNENIIPDLREYAVNDLNANRLKIGG